MSVYKSNFDSNFNIQQLEKLGINNLVNLILKIQAYHLDEANKNVELKISKKEEFHLKSFEMIGELIKKYDSISPYDEVEETINEILKTIETINTTDTEYFEAKRMSLLGRKCEELSKLSLQVASNIHDKEQ